MTLHRNTALILTLACLASCLNHDCSDGSNEISIDYSGCVIPLASSTLDILTWNVENFPQNSNSIPNIKSLIEALDPDVLAVQEIVNESSFNSLLAELPGYDGLVVTSTQSQKLGFIYKTSEITGITTAESLFIDDPCAFPRPAIMTTVTHTSGFATTLINIHLKCCDNTTASCGAAVDRRAQASVKLQDYVIANLSTANVIILGDWNDDITSIGTPFSNFIDDPDNFEFADYVIATGASENWSYQDYPDNTYLGHLDHVLITNELFDNVMEVKTLRPNLCHTNYFRDASDHYPVLLRLNNLN